MEFVLYGVGALFLVGFIKALIDAAKMPRDELHREVMERKEAKARKKTAFQSKKKRGPIGGSHTAEIMMLGEDPVNRWAARKVRDKFF
ncbi:hypothetical protein ACSHT0_17370 [Tepidicaulis sp. LMO-SS28]|uniref:hypothetical protein n=1 Tax=Tepidicaulis sp. LMO-SS28 TaxID=3447455 RepID=UPI003EDFAE4C